jgi:cell division transport system ATP-binding protein
LRPTNFFDAIHLFGRIGVPLIEFQDVAVRYRAARNREVQAVDGVTLKIGAGEWVFFVGATGAGKSTLLKLVYAGAQATRGRVIVDGRDVTNLPPHQIPWLRRKLGVVFQDFQLLEQKTVWENVAFALQVTGTPRHKLSSAVAQALDTVGLSHRAQARPRELSGGEQQRAAIARAIVNEPLILLADEPTGNLDPQTGGEIAEVLMRVHERGTTVVMATHDHALVDAMRRRVVRFAQGKLASDELEGGYHPADEPQGWAAQKGDNLVRAILDNEDERDRRSEEVQRAEAQRHEEAAREVSGAPSETPEIVRGPALDAQRPWEARGNAHPALKNSAPIGTPENPLVVGVEGDDLKLGQ